MTTIANLEDPGAPGNNCAGSLAIHRAGFFSLRFIRPVHANAQNTPQMPQNYPLFLIFSHFFASFRAFPTLFAPKPVVITPNSLSQLAYLAQLHHKPNLIMQIKPNFEPK